MLLAVLTWSFVPLLIKVSGGLESPFLFNAVWRVGVAIAGLLICLREFRLVFLNKDVWDAIRKRLVRFAILCAVLNSFQYALFSWSTHFVDVSIAAVLLELWPIMVILLLAKLLSEELGYRRNIRTILPLLLLAFAGLWFVVASQTGSLSIAGNPLIKLIPGVSLALLAAVVGAFDAFTFSWGQDLANKLLKSNREKDNSLNISQYIENITERFKDGDADVEEYVRKNLILFGSIVAYVITSIPGVVLSTGIGVAREETISFGVVAFGVIGGLTLHGYGNYLFRKANLTTTNLGINAFGYFTPALSVLLLAFFLGVDVAEPTYLLIGIAAIIAANLLINFEAEHLLGFKALVISLWTCGTIVFLRTSTSLGWVASFGGYFDVLFLSATVFALILSFRTARLSSRIQEEDNRAIKLFRELEDLDLRGVITPPYRRARENIVTIDEKEGEEMESAYSEARRAVNDALTRADGSDRKKLLAISVKLDSLAHSRQQGINFGEICALFIFAGLIVGTALLALPAEVVPSAKVVPPAEVNRLTGFLVEMFAMVFPAVIIFLTFNVFDLQRGRVSRILESNPQYGGYGVAFQDTELRERTIKYTGRRTVEQWISVIVGLLLIVAYAGLFLDKWELWPQLIQWAKSWWF